FIDSKKPKAPGIFDQGDFANEFVRSATHQNLDLYSESLLTIHDLTGDQTSLEMAKSLAKTAADVKGGIAERTAPEFLDIRSAQGAIDWAQASVGNMAGSMLGPIIAGTASYSLGKRATGSKTIGRLTGALGAFAGGSLPLGVGEMRKELIEQGITDPKRRGELALKGGIAIGALDAALPQSLIARVMGVGARREIRRSILTRIMAEGLKGAAIEGSTEGIQEIIPRITARLEAGKPVSYRELAVAAINAGAAGAIGGQVAGSVAGLAPEDTAPETPAPLPGTAPRAPLPQTQNAPPGIAIPPATTTPPPTETAPTAESGVTAPPSGVALSLEQQVSVLQQAGLADEQILHMPGPQRTIAVAKAVEAGIKPDVALQPVKPAPMAPKLPKGFRIKSEPQAATKSATAEAGDGTKAAPVKVESEEDIARVRALAGQNATDDQKDAGNYQHVHVKLHGLDIAIETPKGGIRKSRADAKVPWRVKMPADYGRIKGTTNTDGEEMDVFIGPNPTSS
ncbi:MAG: hypothetical protein ACREIB_03405, partial [Pseudomonadota bacterium]